MRTTEQAPEPGEREREQICYHGYTPRQAGAVVGQSEATVRAWIRTGELTAYNTSTTARPRYKITPADLAAFMERRRVNREAAA